MQMAKAITNMNPSARLIAMTVEPGYQYCPSLPIPDEPEEAVAVTVAVGAVESLRGVVPTSWATGLGWIGCCKVKTLVPVVQEVLFNPQIKLPLPQGVRETD